MNDATCNAAEAVSRARLIAGHGGQYLLGTGDYWPHTEAGQMVDTPWTAKNGVWGSDCAGFAICWAWKLRRHRPGFNVGYWSTVSDDINSDSAYQDAIHKKELFTLVPNKVDALPGDVLLYPSIYVSGIRFIGHVSLILGLRPGVTTPTRYADFNVAQCHGPNGFKPGVVETDGSIWDHHDSLWPKPEHRSAIIRPHERK